MSIASRFFVSFYAVSTVLVVAACTTGNNEFVLPPVVVDEAGAVILLDATVAPQDAARVADATALADSAVRVDASNPSDGAAPTDAGSTRPSPTFLANADYAAWLSIDAAWPFGVTQIHEAPTSLDLVSWGAHGGPLSNGLDGNTPQVFRWTLPASATGLAASTSLTAVNSGMPAKFFWGVDGVRDLSGLSASLHSYSTSADAFAGEALLYSAPFSGVTARAFVNGYYSGASVSDGTKSVLAYSGLSALSATANTTMKNGLYAAPLCQSKLVGVAGCQAPALLFGWAGASGPVVSDALGNVFVAASVSDADPVTDKVYALSRSKVIAASAATASVVAELSTGGTNALVALAPEGSNVGWVLGQNFTPGSALYASSYSIGADAITASGTSVPKAITPTNLVEGVGMFSDPEGDLWLAVNLSAKSYFIELRRKP